mmetsp:Transcript_12888/g.47713  ORF Transcript_12888/g.47713 Transcript_12888/m.47713 type:complete len:669 (-) Transcript_12888:130-2136(-)
MKRKAEDLVSRRDSKRGAPSMAESTSRGERPDVDPGVNGDFQVLCDAIPTFLRLLAGYFTRPEQMQVLSFVSKEWKGATPLYLPVREPSFDASDFWDEFSNDAFNKIISGAPLSNVEFLHALEDCDVRALNYRDRADRSEGKDHGDGGGWVFFDMLVYIRPDAPSVVSVDLDRKHMKLELRTTSAFRFRCGGQIIAWARRRPRGSREASPVFFGETKFDEERANLRGNPVDAITAEPAAVPGPGEEWQSLAIVDIGTVDISEYTENEWPDIPDDFHAMPGRRTQELYYAMVQREVKAGVVYVDNALSYMQRTMLMAAIERLRSAQAEPHYRPDSNNVVRHLVHPALYAYVAGESPFFGSQDLPEASMAPRPVETESVPRCWHKILPKNDSDMWGRDYKDSKYQWLPTYFNVAADCKVQIEDYVNGLSRAAHPELYRELEALFERFVPLLEHAWTYGLMFRFQRRFGYTGWRKPTGLGKPPYLVPLRGSRLQVITKIMDYELQPGQEHEGAWQVEGMPHENVVATAMYIASRDDTIQGGKLRFQRAFGEEEGQWFHQASSEMFEFYYDFADGGLLPLGQLQTPGNRMLVFPNTHVHQMMKMVNTGEQPAKCRIVVFLLVNPLVRIVSTQEVPDQRRTMSLESAKEHRLELMKERPLENQDWGHREFYLD